jgi:hypothetical protein
MNRLIKTTLPLLLCILLCSTAQAQGVSVSPVTGAAQASIPLWNLSDRSVSVPIGLHYYSNGVRAGVPEGNAGVGWNISGGGGIYRELRGLPDDYKGTNGDDRKGWLIDNVASQTAGFTTDIDANTIDCSDETQEHAFLNGLNYLIDTEPDIFSVNAPGLSFQFFFDASGAIKVMPYQNVVVTPNINTTSKAITFFSVTNGSGTKYTFNSTTVETRDANQTNGTPQYFTTAYHHYEEPLTFTSAWQLTKIESLDGGVISYSYGDTYTTISGSPVEIIKNVSGTYEVIPQYGTATEVKFSPLESISSDKFTVHFINEGGRVAKVEVTDLLNAQNKKEFHLNYKYYSQAMEVESTGERRAFLLSLTELTDCQPIPPYTFIYKSLVTSSSSISIPFKSHGDFTDYWGYYNGEPSNKIPQIYYYSSQVDAEKLRLSLISGQSPTTTYAGGDKEPNFNYSSIGALISMYIPSGGYFNIEYESNSFIDPVTNLEVLGNGVRVKKITSSPAFTHGTTNASTTEYSYTDASSNSTGKLIYRPVFGFFDASELIRTPFNMAPEGGLLYSRVTETVAQKGKTIYEFNVPATYPYTTYDTWNASKSYVARSTCQPIANMWSGYYTYPFPPNPDLSFQRGLSSKVSYYDEAGTLVADNEMHYENFGTQASEGGIKYEILGDYAYFSKYENIASITRMMEQDISRVKDQVDTQVFLTSTTDYEYSSNLLLPNKVTNTSADGSVTLSTMSYVGDLNITSPQATTETILSELKAANAVSWPLEVSAYTASVAPQNTLSSSLTLYQKNGLNQYLVKESYAHRRSTSFQPASLVAAGSNQELSFSGGYEKVSSVTGFDAVGRPLTSFDGKVSYSGTHYGYNNKFPVLFVSNAQADEVTFSNYEGTQSYAFSVPSGSTYTAGKTGNSALSISGAKTLSRNGIPNRSFNNSFVFSAWVKATVARTLTVRLKDGTSSALLDQEVVNYTDVNEWQFIKATLSTTTTFATYKAEVVTSGGLTLDDVIVYPSNAGVSYQTLNPLFGVTSQSDVNGRIVSNRYDDLGRKVASIDQDDNLLEKYDYGYYKDIEMSLKSTFTRGSSTDVYTVGASETFTAGTSCYTSDYTWYVNGVEEGTGSTLAYTFSAFKSYNIKLEVKDPSTEETSETGTTYYTVPAVLSATATILDENSDPVTGNSTMGKCAQDAGTFERDFNVSLTGSCGNPGNIEYEWVYVLLSNGIEVPFYDTDSQFHFDIIQHPSVYNQSFIIRCKITEICDSGGALGYQVVRKLNLDHTVNFLNETQCQ